MSFRFSGASFWHRAAPSHLGNDGGEDGQQFTGLAVEVIDICAADAAVIAQQFDPKVRFVGLLEETVELGTELGIGSGTRGLAGVRSD